MVENLLPGFLKEGFISAPGYAGWYNITGSNGTPFGMTKAALRNSWLYQFPMLPHAVRTYQSQVAGRPWYITGTPEKASKAVEQLNETASRGDDGHVRFGWDSFMNRTVLDWLCLGQVSFLCPFLNQKTRTARDLLQYVDPLDVQTNPDLNKGEIQDMVLTKARAKNWKKEKAYEYADRRWDYEQMFVYDAWPVGSSGVSIPPLLPIIPAARLAFLIWEHYTQKVDGRQIREVFLVSDNNLAKAIHDGIQMAIALGTGQGNKLPVVPANILGQIAKGIRMDDLITTLGISSIPDSLDLETFMIYYANLIAACLGIPLRTFWHDPRGTNRSLEEVNNERMRTQGSSYFTRWMERNLNLAGFLEDVRMSFEEEVDVSSELTKAQVAKTWAEAIEKFQIAFGSVITPDALVRLLQRRNILPDDAELINEIVTITESPVQAIDMVDGDPHAIMERQQAEYEEELRTKDSESMQRQIDFQRQTQAQQESTVVKFFMPMAKHLMLKHNPSIVAQPTYGQVVVNQEGHVVDYRSKMFTVKEAIALNKQMQPDAFLTMTDFSNEMDQLLEEVNATFKGSGKHTGTGNPAVDGSTTCGVTN